MSLSTVIKDLPKLINDRFASYFSYVVPVVTSIAAGASSTETITFDQDSTFYWAQTTYFADVAGTAVTENTRPIPLINVTMTDTGTGRLLTSLGAPIDSIAGNKAALPFNLPEIRPWAPTSTLRVTYVNYSAGTTYTNLYMVLHGVKVYKK